MCPLRTSGPGIEIAITKRVSPILSVNRTLGMPVLPSFAEHFMLLTLNQGPGPMLDFLGAQAFRAVCAALRLGVFEALGAGPLTAPETARRIGASELGTTLLLEALDPLGYVEKKNERYVNTEMTRKWLLQKSPTSISGGIPFLESMVFDRWGNLGESIRRGRPVISGYDWLEEHPGSWRTYQEGMIAVARMAADEVVARVRLPLTARRLLDVAGGHGLYSVRFCRRYPALSATVFDVPQALEITRETIEAEKMSDRVAVQEGDIWSGELGTNYDVALLFNITHAFLPEKNADLLRMVAGALKRGGLIAIMDQITGKAASSVARALSRLQGLNYFNDLGAKTYTFDEIAGWLKDAGFTKLRRVRLTKMPGFGLALGMRTTH